MRPTSIAIAILLLALLSSCNNEPSKEKYVTKPITEDHSNIADPLARWNAYHLTNYVIEQQLSCFCVYGGEVVKVYVRDNKIIDAVLKSDGKSIFAQYSQSYLTAPELFSLASRLNPDSLASLSIKYDERFGYPKLISVDVDLQMADEEYTYMTTKIERLVN